MNTRKFLEKMSALRNYRRSLSDRRQSLSEIYQQDVKRISESSTSSWQASSRADGRRDSSSDEDEGSNECSQVKETKPKDRQRRFSLDFLFLRKNKSENKQKGRTQSTVGPASECRFDKHPRATTSVE